MSPVTKSKMPLAAVAAAAAIMLAVQPRLAGQNAMLPPPGFHHLRLNSVDPDAAVAFYTRQFPSTAKATWSGFAALKSPNNVMLVFNKVATAPPVLLTSQSYAARMSRPKPSAVTALRNGKRSSLVASYERTLPWPLR